MFGVSVLVNQYLHVQERNVISEYYSQLMGMGFEYAYIYPGMNKVMQAVGRVIRSETDRGAVLLIDSRFAMNEYKSLFPIEWSHARYIRGPDEMMMVLGEFWTNSER